MLKEKSTIISDYEKKLRDISDRVLANKEKFECLHEILTQDGHNLVKSIITYFKWLGFDKIKNMDDESNDSQLWEDIQIEIPDGLFVIEVKGIGGTSTDNDCSQINKIKFRRAEERKKFDVFALYIVNHQKHLPPLDRENPPFKSEQIKDAVNEKRGLISTWQLFNVYFSIKSGAITKEYARKSLLNYGLISFIPSTFIELGKPDSVLKEGYVIIIKSNVPISKKNRLIILRNDRLIPVNILEMQVQNKSVESIILGEVGIKTDQIIKRSDNLYLN